MESELFGYVEGAFSGASSGGSAGEFEHAHRGTIFLDEVGDLPLAAQAALLRVLQEQEVTPVGAARARKVDVRVVAATNRRLDEAVRSGRFRLDLFHRLNVIAVTLPPLRDRPGDLPALVDHLRPRVEKETGFALELDEAVERALAAHHWPGNVRELENCLMKLAVAAQGRPVRLEHLPWRPAAPGLGLGGTGASDARAAQLQEVVRTSKSMTEAAAVLGVTRSTLYRQLERLNLKPGRTVVPTP